MIELENYFATHRNHHLNELKEFLSIPSISAISAHANDVAHAATWLAEKLEHAGIENVEIIQTEGYPIVYGDWLHAENKPTVLIYGHYDVQPVDPLHLWETPPFTPDIRNDKIFARGATDNKGQLFLHLKALEALLHVYKSLPVNVKFCIEGEEEIGSPSFLSFMETNKEKLQADAVVISDSDMWERGKPAITYALRGISVIEVSLKTANSDLHSGMYGGGVPNANHALVTLLSSLHDEKGKVLVEGFYDNVVELTPVEKEEMGKLQFDEQSVKNRLELSSLHGEDGYSFLERVWARPTLEINGMWGGFLGEGAKTVIPNESHAKITCRLVADQQPEEIVQCIEAHMKAHTPAGCVVTVTNFPGANPFRTPIDNPFISTAAKAYKNVYGIEPVYIREGGTITVVERFQSLLGAPVVLMGFGLPEENIHAPNEHFHLENFDKGIRTLITYWNELSLLE